MNQIGEVAKFKIVSNKYLSIEIPENQWYEDEIHLYAVPRIKNGDKEIILSHTSPTEWSYIWELSMNINRDSSGIVYKMTKILKELEINIYKTEGVTPSEDIDFSLWFFINIRFFATKRKLHWRNVEGIKAELKTLIEDRLIKEGLANLEVKELVPNEFLYENHYLVAQEQKINKVVNLIEYFDRPIRFSLINRKGNIPILKLFSSLDISKNEEFIFSTILSDLVQTNYLILRLFSSNQKIMYVNFMHKHEVGAINKLSEIIFQESKGTYNLLYNRSTVKKDKPENEDYESACNWYALIELEDNESNCNEIFKKIEDNELSNGNGSVRVIKYTKNLENIIQKKYKYTKSSRKSNFEKARLFLPIITILFSLYLTVILLIYNDFKIKDLYNNSIILVIMAGVLGAATNLPDLLESIALFKRWIKKE